MGDYFSEEGDPFSAMRTCVEVEEDEPVLARAGWRGRREGYAGDFGEILVGQESDWPILLEKGGLIRICLGSGFMSKLYIGFDLRCEERSTRAEKRRRESKEQSIRIFGSSKHFII